MRLIDADKLREQLLATMPNVYSCLGTCDIVKHIFMADTVDAIPIVHGNWLKATGMMPPEYFGKHICSVCNSFAPNDYYHRTHEWLSPICPNCGAKMDIVQQEN